MAGLKETFSKGITTINVKTNNFMESTTIKTHINTLESECKALYEQIGATVYQQWTGGDTSIVAVETYLQQVKGKQGRDCSRVCKTGGPAEDGGGHSWKEGTANGSNFGCFGFGCSSSRGTDILFPVRQCKQQ